MREITVSSEAKELYKKALGYVTRIQNEVRSANLFQVGELFDLVSSMALSIERSEQLNSYAIYYFDTNDIARSHVVNVAIFSIILAKGIGYNGDELVNIGAAGILHDVGIGRIPQRLWEHKIESFTSDDRNLIQKHPKYGFDAILRSDQQLEELARCTLQHHERINGTGYPNKLLEKEIHDYAKIVSIIDTYESLIHPRNYRDALIPPLGLKEIMDQKGTSFPIKLVKSLIENISIYPAGCFVELNSGEIAKVIKINDRNPIRPVIRILYDSRGYAAKKQIIDLSTNLLLRIERCVPPPGMKQIK